MKTLLLTLALSTVAIAQPPAGTVSQSTVTSVVGTAGALACTLSNSTPALPSGVHVACTLSGVVVLTMDSVVPTGTNGMVGFLSIGGDTVTWMVNQPTGQANFSWQMAANGVAKIGTF